MREEFAVSVHQIGRELLLDREEGEDLLAYAKRLLEQLDWMIDEQQKKCAALRKVIEVAFEPALSAVALTGAGFLGGLNRLGWAWAMHVLA